MVYPDLALFASTCLEAMPRDILVHQVKSMGLLYNALVAGKVPGANPDASQLAPAGYSAALQVHLDEANNALEAVAAAKVACNTDEEEGALHSWMSAIVSATHVLYGCCPPLLADIDTRRVSASIRTPEPLLEAGVGWWKDYVNDIQERFKTHLKLYAGLGLLCKEDIPKPVDVAYEERVLVASQLITVGVFCSNLGFAMSLAALKKPVSTSTSVVVHTLQLVLDNAVALRGVVSEMHNKVVKLWLFVLGELGRRMSGQGCICEVVGTDRLFERDRKRRCE
ncbi:hypothetical protein DFH09DRAFT_1337869 [Mycena vulgaris]|nr:hypothetical protein DFH09DRAFT_1337869 [Mycena vulgaris]